MPLRQPHEPSRSGDLHGNAPDKCETALLLVDVINDFEFPGGERLFRAALPAARALSSLKRRAARAGVPCIYANDNFGRWRSDFGAQIKHVREDGTRGAKIAELLLPSKQDYFVLKVKHSAFYQTCLGLLLEHLAVRRLLVGGFATDNCVQMTSNDAYLRSFALSILDDGCASQTAQAHAAALKQMKRILHAEVLRCGDVAFVRRASGTSVRIRSER
jgi:nicotinamidase-related amidase